MASADVAVNIVTALKDKGIKDTNKAVKGLTTNVKNLGSAMGIAFSATAMISFARTSIRAFAAEEKQIAQLVTTVKNLGLSFQAIAASDYLNTIEIATGINRDQLQPALVSLLQTTGSLTKAQKILNSAINISASGLMDTSSAAKVLAQAYVGNLKGLKGLFLGFTNAELAAMDFNEILIAVNKTFEGQLDASLETTAKKMDQLKIATENAQEILGGAFVDAIVRLSGTNGDLVKFNEQLSKTAEIASTVIGLVGGGWSLKLSKLALDLARGGGGGLDKFFKAKPFPTGTPGFITGKDAQTKKAEALADKRIKDRLAAEAKLAKLAKDKTRLAKIASVFNMESINIAAALKGKITAEERIRLLLQQAILKEDADAAAKLLAQLEAIQKANITNAAKLAEIAYNISTLPKAQNPFADWDEYINGAVSQLGKIGSAIGTINLTNQIAQASLMAGLAAGVDIGAAVRGANMAAQAAAQATGANPPSSISIPGSFPIIQFPETTSALDKQQAQWAAQTQGLATKFGGTPAPAPITIIIQSPAVLYFSFVLGSPRLAI